MRTNLAKVQMPVRSKRSRIDGTVAVPQTQRMLPRRVDRVQVPPIKTQGIKSKLVPFILANIDWDGRGRWIEPFMGSGVVLFNSGAKQLLGGDSNRHIIALYKAIQADVLN